MRLEDIPQPSDQPSSAALTYLEDIIDDGVGVPIDQLLQMTGTHHRAGVAAQLIGLIAAARMPRYRNDDETIQDFVLHSGTRLEDQLPEIAETAVAGAKVIGFSAGEFVACREDDEWGFGGVYPIYPGDAEFQYDEDTKKITELEVCSEDPIPYNRLIHVVDNPALAYGNPYGRPSAKRALALWQASRIVMRQWTITAQRQATPLLHADVDKELADQKIYNDKGECLTNGKGEPLVRPGIVAAKGELAKLQSNQNYIITQGTNVSAINHQSNGQFFKDFAEYLDREILIALGVPETFIAVGNSGLGNSGLAKQHAENFHLMIDATLKRFRQQFMNTVIIPMVIWNFGEQESYGYWKPIPEQEELRVEIGRLIVDVLKEPAVADGINDEQLDIIRARLVELI